MNSYLKREWSRTAQTRSVSVLQDTLLISETDITVHSYFNVHTYRTYHTSHPDNTAHAATAVNINHKMEGF